MGGVDTKKNLPVPVRDTIKGCTILYAIAVILHLTSSRWDKLFDVYASQLRTIGQETPLLATLLFLLNVYFKKVSYTIEKWLITFHKNTILRVMYHVGLE